MLGRIVALLCFVMFTTLSVAQDSELYVDDDLNEITKTEFEKLISQYEYSPLDYDLDTLQIYVAVQRIKKGTLSVEGLQQVRQHVAGVSGQTVPAGNTIAINYHHKKDRCLATSGHDFMRAEHKAHYRRIRKKRAVSQVFLYKHKLGLEILGEQLPWKEDVDLVIQQMFFPINYPCGSYILIDSTGKYYLFKGEHALSTVLELLNDLENTFDGIG